MGQTPQVPAVNMPSAEVEIDEPLVRGLLSDQFPDLAALSIELVAEGWDNAVLRLGDDLCVRLPRRAAAVPLLEHEQRWLPQLAARLPLPVPAPVHVGVPGRGFPWRWSICPWLAGAPAATTAPGDLVEAADVLAGFLAALHQPAPADAPSNPVRGVPVESRLDVWEAAMAAVDVPHVDATRVKRCWQAALDGGPFRGPRVWIHGDLHPANLLVDGGRLCAVIDFGDMAGGDPASDLACAWMLLDSPARERLRRRTSYDDATWARGHAWAAGLGVVMLANSADNAVIRGVGERSLREALADLTATG